jgi:hypothetical protein
MIERNRDDGPIKAITIIDVRSLFFEYANRSKKHTHKLSKMKLDGSNVEITPTWMVRRVTVIYTQIHQHGSPHIE